MKCSMTLLQRLHLRSPRPPYDKIGKVGSAMRLNILGAVLLLATMPALTQEVPNDGLVNSLSNVYRVSNAKTFSISPENFTGEKGKGGMATKGVASNQARDLGQGWKVNPYVI